MESKSIMAVIITFPLFCLFCYYADIHKEYRKTVLFLLCSVLAVTAGCRSMDWPDTLAYAEAFRFHTNELSRYSISDMPHGYNDIGFYFLSAIIRTLSSDCTIYFLIVSFLTFAFLYKSLKKYCVYPLIGLCVYIARFLLGRNFMQIRAALAIAIVICALRYCADRNFRKYLLYVVTACLLHASVILALPFYWINKITLSRNKICIIIAAVFVIAAICSPLIENQVSALSMKYDIALIYTQDYSQYTAGYGLSNPVIYYQTMILMAFMFRERKLCNAIPYYFTIRNGYLYSTTILILLSPFLTLSARTSTIFATFEMFIIPALLYSLEPKHKIIMLVLIGTLIGYIFQANLNSLE